MSLDLGGTHAALAVATLASIRQRSELRVVSTTRLAPLLPQIVDWARSVGEDEQPVGLGIGFPGIMNAARDRVTSTNGKYEDAVDLDLPAWCEAELGLPLRLENDARMALLGETIAGAAKGRQDVVMLMLGTGIGCAVLSRGRLYTGAHGQGGVLGGHITVRVGGRECTCGGRGCAESEASGWALPAIAAAWPDYRQSPFRDGSQDFRRLFELAKAGDSVCRQIRDYCIEVWAATVVSAVHQFDPELVLLGGGVMQSAEVILPVVQNCVDRAWTPWGKVEVRAAQLGADAALFGPLSLFSEELR